MEWLMWGGLGRGRGGRDVSKYYTTRQSAQWGMYTPDQRYRQFLKSTKYVALTLEMAVVCYML